MFHLGVREGNFCEGNRFDAAIHNLDLPAESLDPRGDRGNGVFAFGCCMPFVTRTGAVLETKSTLQSGLAARNASTPAFVTAL